MLFLLYFAFGSFMRAWLKYVRDILKSHGILELIKTFKYQLTEICFQMKTHKSDFARLVQNCKNITQMLEAMDKKCT